MPGVQLTCARSAQLAERFPHMRFSAILITDIDLARFSGVVKNFAADVAQSLSRGSDSARDCLSVNEAFFAANGRGFPLPGQIASARRKGFPPAPPAVLALLALEAVTGVLMGVQNLDAIDDSLILDSLTAEEFFVGMRGNTVTCSPGEIVVRDRSGIIASLFQGPDKRTAVTAEGRNLVLYVFDADPSLEEGHDRATDLAATLIQEPVGTTTVLRTS